MAKKSTKATFALTLGNILVCIAAAFGLVAFFMFFASAISGSGNLLGSQVSYSGAQVAFGYSDGDNKILAFNFFAFLGLFLLPLAGVALTVLFFILRKNLYVYIALGCFALAAILAFLTCVFFKMSVVNGTYYDLYTWKLATGTILAGIFNIIACGSLAVKLFLKK